MTTSKKTTKYTKEEALAIVEAHNKLTYPINGYAAKSLLKEFNNEKQKTECALQKERAINDYYALEIEADENDLKFITNLRSEGMTDEDIKTYFEARWQAVYKSGMLISMNTSTIYDDWSPAGADLYYKNRLDTARNRKMTEQVAQCRHLHTHSEDCKGVHPNLSRSIILAQHLLERGGWAVTATGAAIQLLSPKRTLWLLVTEDFSLISLEKFDPDDAVATASAAIQDGQKITTWSQFETFVRTGGELS